MVREHVAWHGPPQGERSPRFSFQVRWFFVLLDVGFFLGSVLLALFARRLRPGPRSRLWHVHGLVPIAWAALALFLLVESFADLSGFQLWRRAPMLSLSGSLLLVLPLWVVPRRARPWAAFALVSAVSVLVVGDLAYMRFFGSIMPLGAAAASHQILDTGASIVALLRPASAWIVLVPLALLVLAVRWPTPLPSERPAGRGRWLAGWVVAVLVLVAVFPAVRRLYRATTGDLARRVFSDQANVGRLGVLNAHMFELMRGVKERAKREHLDSQQRQRIEAFFAERAGDTPVAPSVTTPPNLLMIQVEALQQWVVGARVKQQEVTPFLNRAHEHGLYYPNVFDQTSHGRTSDAEYLVLTSQHPLSHGALCFLRDENHFVTLAHVLRERGYTTLSAHPYKRGYWNRAVLHPRYGFERSLFRRELGGGLVVGWGLADGVFFERMVPELQALPQPYFALLVTLGLHHPYNRFPRHLSAMEVGDLEGTSLGNYLLAMNYFDAVLEVFLAELRARGLLENTIVAIYGDHDSRLETPPEVLALAGIGRWDPSVPARIERVPLLIMLPNQEAHGVVSTVGGQVDIGPTLLHHMGIDRPRGFVGRPLLPGEVGFAAMPDGSAATSDRIFVATGRDIRRTGSCFDFPAGAARPRKDCKDLRERARDELEISRAVLDHDLYRDLAGPSP
jgi:phosphoglycerol transferase MdoB-like AlkP superfamily enzyme